MALGAADAWTAEACWACEGVPDVGCETDPGTAWAPTDWVNDVELTDVIATAPAETVVPELVEDPPFAGETFEDEGATTTIDWSPTLSLMPSKSVN